MKMQDSFHKFAAKVSDITGSPWAFLCALLFILAWGASGPIFGFSDTWQLVVNTSTTIVTFLMVFLIQHTQNRDTRALHVKLDEIIHAIPEARNEMAKAEDMSEDDLKTALAESRHPNSNEDS